MLFRSEHRLFTWWDFQCDELFQQCSMIEFVYLLIFIKSPNLRKDCSGCHYESTRPGKCEKDWSTKSTILVLRRKEGGEGKQNAYMRLKQEPIRHPVGIRFSDRRINHQMPLKWLDNDGMGEDRYAVSIN